MSALADRTALSNDVDERLAAFAQPWGVALDEIPRGNVVLGFGAALSTVVLKVIRNEKKRGVAATGKC